MLCFGTVISDFLKSSLSSWGNRLSRYFCGVEGLSHTNTLPNQLETVPADRIRQQQHKRRLLVPRHESNRSQNSDTMSAFVNNALIMPPSDWQANAHIHLRCLGCAGLTFQKLKKARDEMWKQRKRVGDDCAECHLIVLCCRCAHV
jgi:hypothetical protein